MPNHPIPAPAPRFRVAGHEADGPAAAAADARRAGIDGPLPVEARLSDGTWIPAVVFAAGLSAADFDAIADDAR